MFLTKGCSVFCSGEVVVAITMFFESADRVLQIQELPENNPKSDCSVRYRASTSGQKYPLSS